MEDDMIYEIEQPNKIYARVNEKSVVTHIFSEAFEQPTDRDICIDEINTDRHGANTYQVYDENGIANYEIVNGKLTMRDKIVDLISLQNQREIVRLKQMLSATDYQAIKFAEGEMTAEEFAPIKEQRSIWRMQINKLEEKGDRV